MSAAKCCLLKCWQVKNNKKQTRKQEKAETKQRMLPCCGHILVIFWARGQSLFCIQYCVMYDDRDSQSCRACGHYSFQYTWRYMCALSWSPLVYIVRHANPFNPLPPSRLIHTCTLHVTPLAAPPPTTDYLHPLLEMVRWRKRDEWTRRQLSGSQVATILSHSLPTALRWWRRQGMHVTFVPIEPSSSCRI